METSEVILRATNSASNLGRRQRCNGSAHAEKDLPKLESPWSAEGTLLHFFDAHPEESQAKLEPEQREVLARNKGLRDKFIEATLQRIGIPPDAECRIMVEKEFILCDELGEPVESHGQMVPGHPDLVYFYPAYSVCLIFDSKFGRVPVQKAWTNLQLRHYAVALHDRLAADTTIVAITQPWAKSPDDLHSAEYSAKDMPLFRQELIDVIRSTDPLDAPRNASVEACTYCAACAYCPVAVTAATDLAVVKMADITISELEALGPQIELAKKVCEAWLKRMKYVAKQFPDQLKIYELDKEKERRTIENIPMAWKLLQDAGILPKDDANALLALCKLSVGEVEAHVLIQEKITVKGAELRIKDVLGPLIVRKPMDRSLVKKSEGIYGK